MKATLVYWHKAHIQGHFVLEMEIYQVGVPFEYPDGIKDGLILVDTKTGRKVLMDNHHPKGPHVHVDDQEFPYIFIDEEKLINDFKSLAQTYLGVDL